MSLWIPISLVAALVQTLRFLLQKQLKSLGLTTGGATFSRFLFGLPLIWLVILGLSSAGYSSGPTSPAFWAWCLTGGLGQIIGTYCTVSLFSQRNFAVGIAFTKTETVQVALFSAVLLAEPVSAGGWAAILTGLGGVLLLSWPKGTALGGALWNRSLATGILAGATFAVSAIGYRAASLALGEGSYIFRAAWSLACVVTLQTLMMLAFLWLKERATIGQVLRAWRATFLVGLTGILGSLCWFTAFTLQNAAYVRAFGQVELIFGLMAGWLFLRERVSQRELAGMLLLGLSLLALILAA